MGSAVDSISNAAGAAADSISLDPAKLENVKNLDGGAIRAACPACRADGSDKTGDHLLIKPDGKFGCATHPDDQEHRKEIFRLTGTRLLPVPSPNGRAKRNGSPAKSNPVFNWQKCVDAFTDEHAQRLASWRGLSAEFVRWLHAQAILGIFDGKTAFANHGGGSKVVSCHVRLESGNWLFKPTGQKTAALVFGDAKAAGFILAFESQWDAFAVMDKLGWHAANGLPDATCFVTRGAGNGKLIHGQFAPDAICYAFKQNDDAGERWLADISRNALCKVLVVTTPAPHKDANDWTRAGAGKAEIETAIFREAKPVKLESAKVESAQAGDFAEVTAQVRGEILAALGDKNTAPASQRQKICECVVSGLVKIGRFYFHVELRDFDSALFFNGFTKRLERIRADSFASWLSDWLCINRAAPLFRFIFAAVETASLSSADTTGILPENFWASRPGAIYLSNGDGRAVKITPGNVQLVDNGTDGVLFAAGKTCAPWQFVTPQDIFETCQLFRDAHTTAGHAPDLLRLWLYSLPMNQRTKPPLVLSGEIGSGKTRLAKGMAEFYGVPFVAHKAEEAAENDFWPCVDAGGIFTLDNADTRVRWLADTLAAASTDGCSQRRRLYTNAETITLRPRAGLVVTSANPSFAGDSGLADRLLLLRMARRDDAQTDDTALGDEILANRDAGLSHVAATLAKALADTAPTPGRLNARHPDFASFAVRIGRAIGREAEAVAALQAAEADKSTFCLENDTVASALIAYLQTVELFTGTAKELREPLIAVDSDLTDRLSAKRLGKHLGKIMPHLRKTLATAKSEHDRKGFTIFTFKAAHQTGSADFAEFQSAISPKPLREGES